MLSSRLPFALAILLGGCVSDPVAAPDASTDGTTEGGDDAGGDALPPPTGAFAWEVNGVASATPLPSVATNGKGDIAVVASLTQATTINGLSVPAPASPGLVVFKMKADKTMYWAKSYPISTPQSIALDESGAVYVVGAFQQDQTFGSAPVITLDSQNVNANDPASVVLKLRANDGTPEWGRTFSLSNADAGSPVATSVCKTVATRGNDVVVGCDFTGQVGFEPKKQPFQYRVAAGALADALVMTLDPADGTTLWSKHLSGGANEFLNALSFDMAGGVLAVGEFGSPTLTVDGVSTFTNNGGGRGFVLRFDANAPHMTTLSTMWGAPNVGVILQAVTELPGGDLAMCGSFLGAPSLGTGVVQSKGDYDAFVLRTDKSGTTKWAQTYGGTVFDRCADVAADSTGHIAIGGTNRSSTVAISGKPIPDPASGQPAGHVAKLDGAGVGLWAFGHPPAPNEVASSSVGGVRFLPGGDVVLAGVFTGRVDLGGGFVQSAGGGTQSSLFVVRRAR